MTNAIVHTIGGVAVVEAEPVERVCEVRSARPADDAFIYRSWLDGSYEVCPVRPAVRPADYYRAWRQLAAVLRMRPDVETVVACLPGQPDTLLGFACGAIGRHLHWCYVKQPFRGLGIAREMLTALCLTGAGECSHWSPRLHKAGWLYRPELLRKGRA